MMIGAWFGRAVVLGLALLASTACASHSDRLKDMRSALDANQPTKAIERLNEELDVDSSKALPAKTNGDSALLLLDRAMILQQLQDYTLSSRDLEVADKQIEILDLSRNAAHEVGKYLFSDDVGPYRSPPYEKQLINTVNMLNYLVRSDLNGARVEARRLAVIQKYLRERDPDGSGFMGPGSYLAGLTFEKSGRLDEALNYYEEALTYGDYPSLSEPVARLLARTGRSSPRLRAAAARSTADVTDAGANDAEVVVVISFGRVPPKLARRVPIGLALTYASDALSPTDRARANHLAAQGLVTWVNYPELGRARGDYDVPGFAIGGKWSKLEGAVALDLEARKAWDDAKGTVIAGAITRMLTRVVAGEAVRKTADDSLVGTLLSLGVQATLTATDTPDTRSWSTLPARMAIGRVRLPPGTHYVDLRARGVQRRHELVLAAGDFRVLAHTVLF